MDSASGALVQAQLNDDKKNDVSTAPETYTNRIRRPFDDTFVRRSRNIAPRIGRRRGVSVRRQWDDINRPVHNEIDKFVNERANRLRA